VSENGTTAVLAQADAGGAGAPVPSAPPPTGPRMPKRTLWVALPERTPGGEVAYPGFKVRVWVNFPARFAEQLKSGTEEEKSETLRRIVVAHNGWLDDEGEPFPPADSPDFYKQLPQELATLILYSIMEAMQSFPNSLLRTRQASTGI
jgi:hypothetical protein